jgi:glycosyltransferase involved in cell wall biosynthesis
MKSSAQRSLHVCMLAYANYFTDARIKNYVDALLDANAFVDVIALGRSRSTTENGSLWIKTCLSKHWGRGVTRYVLVQVLFLVEAFYWMFVRSFRHKYQVIHVHNIPDVLVLAALPFRLVGSKIILDIHDTMPEAFATKFDHGVDSPQTKLLVFEERLSAWSAQRVITTNSLQKEVLVRHGLPAEKIEIILNVGNTKIFKPRTVHTGTGDLWLGYHGTIAKRLGLLLILEALRQVKEECPRMRFLCIGEGDDLGAMLSFIEENGLKDVVMPHEFVEVEKLPEMLQCVDVGMIGNLRETELKRSYMLPVKMLEYAAMGIPTVAPRLKVIQAYFSDAVTFYYEPDDPESLANTLQSIYENRSLIRSKANHLEEFNSKYNWKEIGQKYLNLLTELVHPK